jgi:hypothetical protein
LELLAYLADALLPSPKTRKSNSVVSVREVGTGVDGGPRTKKLVPVSTLVSRAEKNS